MHSAEISYLAKARRAKIYRGLTFMALAATVVYAIVIFLEDKLMYYYTPSQALEKGLDITQKIRLGGVVVPGSVKTQPGTIAISFVLTDFNLDIEVTYTGLVPDLFREGQGCVCEGKLLDDGKFHASTVLAKHDESYIPGDIAEEIQRTLREKERKMEELEVLMRDEEPHNNVEKESAPPSTSGWETFRPS